MNQSVATPQDVHALCRRKLLEGDRTDYYSALFTPADRRQAMFALYALWHEVREIIDECSEPEVALRKLDWWRNEIQAMFAGQAHHPIAVALTPALAAYSLSEAPFIALLDGLAHHAHTSHYETFNEWRDHARATRGQLFKLVSAICGYQHQATVDQATELGGLQEMAFALRDVGADARRGYVYLPFEDLAQCNVSAEDVYAGRDSDGIRALLAFEIDRLCVNIENALALIPASDRRRQTSIAVSTDLTLALLNEIRADGYRVLTQRLELTPVRQLWRGWRASRRFRRAA